MKRVRDVAHAAVDGTWSADSVANWSDNKLASYRGYKADLNIPLDRKSITYDSKLEGVL